MKAKMDAAVGADRFSLPRIHDAVVADLKQLPVEAGLSEIAGQLTSKQLTALRRALIRWSFFIELVKKPKIETTKYEVRWAARLGVGDPRYLGYHECVAFYEAAVVQLVADIAADLTRLETLKAFLDYPLNAYEIPLDYDERHPVNGIHQPDNVTWVWSQDAWETVGLRKHLWQPTNQLRAVFKKVYDKIQVKTYLTDRVLTGDHKTNREKRWETHPDSVHFALRRYCLGIERILVESVCMFDGFPGDERQKLYDAGVLPERDMARCPVTMKPLSYPELRSQLLDPNHGTSSFQVGHLNPLKAINDDPTNGHTAANIAWISADGNRIQGSHTLKDTRQMIIDIFENYIKFGIVEPD
jgi:hypothetical protein